MTDHIRRNCGFVDLRGRPDKAKDIAEASDSPALQQLLVHVAKVGSAIFTLGCGLGAHQEPTYVPLRRREVAGGYIQLASVHYDHAKTESYAAFANAIVANVKPRAGKDIWEIDFVGQMVNFQLHSEPKGVYPSLSINFFAAARDPFCALQSRERLVQAIDVATALPATLRSFAWAT
jgi:hypothetical protein